MSAANQPTIEDAIRRVAPIFWQIEQRLERERREAPPRTDDRRSA